MGDDPQDEPAPSERVPPIFPADPPPRRDDWTRDPGPARQLPDDWTRDAGPSFRIDKDPETHDPGDTESPTGGGA